VYVPGRGNLEKKLGDFLEFAMSQKNAMVFIDEPSMVKLPQAFHDLHRLGHARGLGVTIATHTIWDLPHVTQQAHHLFLFRIDRVVEINTLRQVCSPACIGWLPKAPKYWVWHRGAEHDGPVEPIPIGAPPPAQPKEVAPEGGPPV
jgi:hypothetical protein